MTQEQWVNFLYFAAGFSVSLLGVVNQWLDSRAKHQERYEAILQRLTALEKVVSRQTAARERQLLKMATQRTTEELSAEMREALVSVKRLPDIEARLEEVSTHSRQRVKEIQERVIDDVLADIGGISIEEINALVADITLVPPKDAAAPD